MMTAAQPTPPLPERLFRRCLYCSAPFGMNALFGRVPPGRRLTYDPAKYRLWSVCDRCGRWNLIPADERVDAIDVLEGVVHGRASLRAATDNVSLFEYEDIAIVRVGAAPLVERVFWRYGSELERRDAALRRPATRFFTSAFDAIATAGDRAGVWRLGPDWGPRPAIDLVRWRRFGSEAWSGRSACPHCNSVLRSLRFDVSWWLHPRVENGELVVGVPCTRCDPWTPRNVFDVAGDDAALVLRRVLAYQHVAGASPRQLREATKLVERAGTGGRLVAELATGSTSLWRLGATRALALDIALNHAVEQHELTRRLHGIHAAWRVEDALAAIVDDDLS
jgi:hypothetical protein